MPQKIISLFHVQVNYGSGAKNLMSIEQRQSITLVHGEFGPQHSSSGALSETAKPQGTLPPHVLRCELCAKLEIGQRSQPFFFCFVFFKFAANYKLPWQKGFYYCPLASGATRSWITSILQYGRSCVFTDCRFRWIHRDQWIHRHVYILSLKFIKTL